MATEGEKSAIGLRLPTAAGVSLGLWFILLAFGGACLAWYYSSIHYFPTFAWQESVTYLAVLSIVGGALVLSFGLLAFMPGMVWSEVLLSDRRLKDTALLYQPTSNQKEPGLNQKEPCLRTVSWTIGWPFAFFMFTYHFLVISVSSLGSAWRITTTWAGAVFLISAATSLFVDQVNDILAKRWTLPAKPRPSTERFTRESLRSKAAFASSTLFGVVAFRILYESIEGRNYSRAMVIAGADLLIAALIAALFFVQQVKYILGKRWFLSAKPTPPTEPGPPHESLRSSMYKYEAAFAGSMLFGVAALGIIDELIVAHDQSLGSIVMGFVCTAIVVAANILVSMIYGTRRLAAVMVAAFAALLILAAGEGVEANDSVLHKIMGSYGLGESNRYVLIVNSDGRRQLEAQSVGVEPAGSLGRLRDVAILSRLGETYFFSWCGQKVALQKPVVASWSSELTNDDILRWKRGGLEDDDIIHGIKQAAGVDFSMTKKDTEKLKDNGISDTVISKMKERESASPRCDRRINSRVSAGLPGWEGAEEQMLARTQGAEP
jgi:hypothetical protein